jgi:UDP-2,3-diacylglucosamine pyrophosphatase LpxH
MLDGMGFKKISLSKKIKESVKKAIKVISDFEKTSAGIAIDMKYDYVVCGHIHQPVIKQYWNEKGMVNYLNSGDWVENLTSLEFNGREWNVIKYDESAYEDRAEEELPSKSFEIKLPPFSSVA